MTSEKKKKRNRTLVEKINNFSEKVFRYFNLRILNLNLHVHLLCHRYKCHLASCLVEVFGFLRT